MPGANLQISGVIFDHDKTLYPLVRASELIPNEWVLDLDLYEEDDIAQKLLPPGDTYKLILVHIEQPAWKKLIAAAPDDAIIVRFKASGFPDTRQPDEGPRVLYCRKPLPIPGRNGVTCEDLERLVLAVNDPARRDALISGSYTPELGLLFGHRAPANPRAAQGPDDVDATPSAPGPISAHEPHSPGEPVVWLGCQGAAIRIAFNATSMVSSTTDKLALLSAALGVPQEIAEVDGWLRARKAKVLGTFGLTPEQETQTQATPQAICILLDSLAEAKKGLRSGEEVWRYIRDLRLP